MKNIIITFGGESCERDISVITAITAYNAVFATYRIFPIYLKDDKFYSVKNISKIKEIANFSLSNFYEVEFKCGCMQKTGIFSKKIPISCAIICNHGGVGENGALEGFFETVGIPCTAPDVFQCAMFMDKIFTKQFLNNWVRTLPWQELHKGESCNLNKIEYPAIVKPARLGSSIGIGIAKTESELKERLEFAFNFDSIVLVEKALENFIEFNCAAFKYKGKTIVSDVEMLSFEREFYDFESKYLSSQIANREFPAKISDVLKDEIKETTKLIYEKSRCKGVIRIDYLYDGNLYVNEVNAVPGSLSFYLFKNKNIDMEKLLDMLIEESEKEFKKRKELINTFESSILENINVDKLTFGVKK